MLVILLLPEALDRRTAVSARGTVVEGVEKSAIRGVSRSCCGGEEMRDGGLEWLHYFRILVSSTPLIQNPLSHVLWILKNRKTEGNRILYCLKNILGTSVSFLGYVEFISTAVSSI